MVQFEELEVMPGGLSSLDYRDLLRKLDFDGVDEVSDDETSQYAAMALQDLKPEEAATVVLSHLLSGRLKPGQIRNLSEEMKDERQWEEHPDLYCHEPIFNAQVLLHAAFPSEYPAPDILQVTVLIEAISSEGKSLLRKPMSEPLLVRILADGMPEAAILKRFFGDQLEKGPFPEASQILWTYSVEEQAPSEQQGPRSLVTLYSSRYWVGPLDGADDYTSAAFADDE